MNTAPCKRLLAGLRFTPAPCAGISDRRFFRRLAFTVFVQGIGMDGCFLVIGFYIKQQFAISKNQNTMMMETQGLAAIFVMWVLCKTTALSRFVGVDRLANLGSITIADKPLIVNLGERRVIILGLMVNVSFFLG